MDNTTNQNENNFFHFDKHGKKKTLKQITQQEKNFFERLYTAVRIDNFSLINQVGKLKRIQLKTKNFFRKHEEEFNLKPVVYIMNQQLYLCPAIEQNDRIYFHAPDGFHRYQKNLSENDITEFRYVDYTTEYGYVFHPDYPYAIILDNLIQPEKTIDVEKKQVYQEALNTLSRTKNASMSFDLSNEEYKMMRLIAVAFFVGGLGIGFILTFYLL